MPDALHLDAISKRYGRGRTVIDGLTHVFEPGTATALVGPNGSGKTTLIRLITALSFPTAGRITYGSLDIHKHPSKWIRHIGFVDDAGQLPVYLNGVELLEWVSRSRGTYDALGSDGIHNLLDSVHLDERRENLIGTYSTGMMKKVHVAAALAGAPRVLVLDEPFRGLDDQAHAAVETLLRAFVEEGGLLIMASHFGATVKRLCGAVMTLPEGVVSAPI